MKYNPNIHNRKSIRLKGYDYSKAGLYFITICVQNRACLFGNITNGKMNLNDAGVMVENEWVALPKRFQNIKLHEYIVMPNHFHAILEIVPKNKNTSTQNENIVGPTLVVDPNNKKGHPNGQPQGMPQQETNLDIPPRKKTLGDMVGAFQSITTVEYIRGVKNNNWQRFDKKLWQRNYWEHIIRNEPEYYRIANYIRENPDKWDKDKLKPDN
ncbi:MAG: transposase [Bacteroidota bacterium]